MFSFANAHCMNDVMWVGKTYPGMIFECSLKTQVGLVSDYDLLALDSILG